ncbi:MAG: efflux RND transporter periplasmic adaptor subunit [Bacteroidales bacterium]|nr:efflux RND transporter periplasmic adaptor subunit [Bacteroidales bacterium]
MITKKKFILIALMGIFAACNNEQSPEQIQQEINDKKKQISKLKQEVTKLENSLSNDSIYAAPVNIKIIKPETFVHKIEVNGTVEAEQQANISPEINGQIKQIYVNEGQRVSKGRLLAELSTEVTRKSIQEIKTSLELARTTYKKQKKLWDQNIGSEIQYLQAKNQIESLESSLETMKAQLDMAKIKAPFSGIVDDIFMKVGDLAIPGTPVMNIVNLRQLNVNADISESYLSKIQAGDTVQISFPAYPGIKMKAPVFRTGNIIKPDNRTFKVQVNITNIKEKLKPNIISVLRINDYTNHQAFIVPSIIIKKDMKGDFLFVAEEDDNGVLIAEKRYVETGKSYKNKSEIIGGLSENDRVIVDGYNMVSSGSNIEIKNSY